MRKYTIHLSDGLPRTYQGTTGSPFRDVHTFLKIRKFWRLTQNTVSGVSPICLVPSCAVRWLGNSLNLYGSEQLGKRTKRILFRDVWVAQPIKHSILDFGSGHDLKGSETEPQVRLCANGVEPAWDFVSLSLSLSLCPSRTHTCACMLSRSLSLSLSQTLKTIEEIFHWMASTFSTNSVILKWREAGS